jgi:hypothetical protein
VLRRMWKLCTVCIATGPCNIPPVILWAFHH